MILAQRDELRARSIRAIALFGSRARGEARADSDIDLLIELEPNSGTTLVDLAELKQSLEDLFGVRVDLTVSGGLKPRLEENIRRDARYAFQA